MRHASTCLMLWRASACHCTSMSIRAVYTNAKPYECAIVHQPKTLPDFRHENRASLLPDSHVESLVRIAFCVLWCIWGEALLDFCHANKVKCCRIFTVEIWQLLQTHLESIDRDHAHSETKLQSPTHLKPQKLMPISCYQLPMCKNYEFTKTEDYLRTGVVGCLTPSPHVTRLPNSRINIFYPSTLN